MDHMDFTSFPVQVAILAENGRFLTQEETHNILELMRFSRVYRANPYSGTSIITTENYDSIREMISFQFEKIPNDINVSFEWISSNEFGIYIELV